MGANLVRWALVAALCPLFISAIVPPNAPPPWDIMAWETFATMVTPANRPGMKAVTFETWADETDIYTPPAPHWPGPGGKMLHRALAAQALASSAPHPMLATVRPDSCATPPNGAAGNFPASACIGEEVRHNRVVFDYVNSHHLYSTDGLKQAFAAGKPADFPFGAIVVKADWIPVNDILLWLPKAYHSPDEVQRAYYTNFAMLNGKKTEFALAGMSVQAKRAPHWLWMTFEHRSNLGRCDDIGCHDSFGAMVPNVAPGATNTDYGPCVKSRSAMEMLERVHADAVWANYCLKGTQVDYMEPDGTTATLLANSVIERMNKNMPMKQTSCISCHAYASFNGDAQPNYPALKSRPTGAFKNALLGNYLQNDALWSFFAIPSK